MRVRPKIHVVWVHLLKSGLNSIWTENLKIDLFLDIYPWGINHSMYESLLDFYELPYSYRVLKRIFSVDA